MFPKIKKIQDGQVLRTNVQYLKSTVGLAIDQDLCQGCGICMKICPTQALDRGPVGISKKDDRYNLQPVVLDANNCSFCGLCTYMCPWNAITLYKDSKEIALDDLTIVQENAVPQLDYSMAKCKEGVNDAKSYLEGDIEITTKQCPGGCNTCVQVCPTQALSIEKPDLPWDKGRTIVVDKEKCILCGTCTNACPVFDAIKITITNVKSKGKYNAVFWDRIVDQLKISRMREGKKIN